MRSRRLIVADDDDDIRMLVAMSLSHLGGHEIRTCSTGLAVLELAAEWLPDAVLMDVRMPVMDGPTAAERLAAQPTTSTIPVILMTASVRQEERQAFAALKIAGVISKPFDPMTLSDDVTAMLGWS
jgi:CheY-like chemotaxis protein